MRIIDFFDRAARQFADRDCVVDDRQSLSFADVERRSHILAGSFRNLGLPEGAKIGVLAPNCAEAFVALLGIFRAGAIWVPVNNRSTSIELAHFLALVECDLLLVHSDYAYLGIDAASGCKGLCRLFQLDDSDGPLPPIGSVASETVGYPSPDFDPGDICSVFSTGGTTGMPKAALWSHKVWRTLIANFHAGIHHEGAPVHLVAAPLTHAAGVISIPLLAIGATTVMIPRAEPELIMQSIERHRVTTIFLPPTVIYTMLAHPAVRSYDYGSLQNLIYAAAPMSVEKLRDAMDVFGPVLVQTFGQAEAPMVCTVFSRHDHVAALRDAPERLASCGRPGLFSELAVMDDEGNLLPPGETGELVVRGDLVMAGYFNNPEATMESRADGWHHTGDIGRLDADGFVYITDRKRDMIITGGFNVFPSEIEQVIWSHEAVRDCAVIGVPDSKWGEAVVAVVELKNGRSCDAAEIVALVKSALGSVKTPKAVEFWPELPRSNVGKVLKRAIRNSFWKAEGRRI